MNRRLRFSVIGAGGVFLRAVPDSGSRQPLRAARGEEAADERQQSEGDTVTSGGAVNDPLGLAIAPNGDVLTTNGGDGNLVETTPGGQQVAVKMLDTSPAPPGPNGNGTLFGLAVVPDGSGVYFVDDGTNTLDLLH